MDWIDDIKKPQHSALNIFEHNQKWFYLSDMNVAIYTIRPYKFFLFFLILVNRVCGWAWIEFKEKPTAHQKYML